MLEQLLLFVISLVANIFSAFAGGGAGLIQLPALIFLCLPFAVALATHKVASVALGVGATIRHAREDALERRFALFILAAGLPGVVLGASLILQVPDRVAQVALGILTAGLGLYSWLKQGLGLNHAPSHRDTRGFIIGGGVLFVIGVLNGSLTSGTGLFVTLWLVRWFGPRLGLVDRPGERKIHAEPMPTAGGLAIWLGIVLPLTAGYLLLFATFGSGGDAARGTHDQSGGR